MPVVIREKECRQHPKYRLDLMETDICELGRGVPKITEIYGKPLVEQGRLAMTLPDKLQSKNQKYITIRKKERIQGCAKGL